MTLRFKAVLAIVFVLAFTIVSTIVIIAWRQNTGHQTQTKLVTILEGVQQTNNFIKDCTDPAGACYKQGQANQAQVLERVQDIFVDVAAITVVCARDPNNLTLPEVRACVSAGLR